MGGDFHRKTCRRYNDAGHAHELTFSCYQRRRFLASDRTCEYLARSLVRTKEIHLFHIWAYVFMPDHVHLLIWPTQEEYSISKMLLSIKQPVARSALYYLRKNNPDGLRWLATGQKSAPYRFWQDGGGYDRNITSAKTLQEVVKYIHNNPVRRALVEEPEAWPWSSAAAWADMERGRIPVDRESFPLS